MSKSMFNVRYDLAQVTRKFAALRDPSRRTRIMNEAGAKVVEKLAGWIYRRSRSRHETARRLGAEPTGILEFIGANAGTAFSKGGGKIYKRTVAGGKYSIFISGVPFIQKAFRPLNIVPQKASALTIPIHHDSFRTRARDMEGKGYSTFIIRAKSGKSYIMGKKQGQTRPVPLYALVKSAKIPRDAQLLPQARLMDIWTRNAIKEGLLK